MLREGEVASGDAIEYASPPDNGLTIADIVNLYTSNAENQDLLRRTSELGALPDGWKDYFRKRLWDADA